MHCHRNSRISRRALLFHSGCAVAASTVAANALGTKPLSRDRQPSNDLQGLIEAHKTAYISFGKAVHEKGSRSRDHIKAGRKEERALLAICTFPAVWEVDRLGKARYLLEIEARCELDLPEHMQALLRSTM
ncbi:hypothetical protein DBIPINDM_006229 [Mesorhizobium sp. AR02]|nr:hypothetical protein DBIPINDM_006229 [Mesorhizobium sp. AR02]